MLLCRGYTSKSYRRFQSRYLTVALGGAIPPLLGSCLSKAGFFPNGLEVEVFPLRQAGKTVHDFQRFTQVVGNQESDSAFHAGYEDSTPSTRSIFWKAGDHELNIGALAAREMEHVLSTVPDAKHWTVDDTGHFFDGNGSRLAGERLKQSLSDPGWDGIGVSTLRRGAFSKTHIWDAGNIQGSGPALSEAALLKSTQDVSGTAAKTNTGDLVDGDGSRLAGERLRQSLSNPEGDGDGVSTLRRGVFSKILLSSETGERDKSGVLAKSSGETPQNVSGAASDGRLLGDLERVLYSQKEAEPLNPEAEKFAGAFAPVLQAAGAALERARGESEVLYSQASQADEIAKALKAGTTGTKALELVSTAAGRKLTVAENRNLQTQILNAAKRVDPTVLDPDARLEAAATLVARNLCLGVELGVFGGCSGSAPFDGAAGTTGRSAALAGQGEDS